jgi:metal-responsive CopG/Arc/MetJ family transcriptional regulator
MTIFTSKTRGCSVRIPLDLFRKMELYLIDNQIGNRSEFISSLIKDKLENQ